MPTSTTNYGLIKPGTDDPILIGQINDNMDTVDTVLKDHSDKIDAAALGIKYKGEVNYYADLPNNAEIGDAYTVKYAGSSGTTLDGTEYVWGAVSGVNQWINFSKDSYSKAEVDALLALKQNALNSAQLAAANSGINSEKVAQYDSTTELEAKDRAALVELVDGSAKNLLKNDAASQSTVVVNPDGTMTINGTNSGSVNLEISVSTVLSAGDYVLSAGDIASSVYLTARIATGGDQYTCTGPTKFVSFHLDAETQIERIYLFINSGTAISNLTVKPMICSKAAWDISRAYQPYCPSYQELYEMVKALQANQ